MLVLCTPLQVKCYPFVFVHKLSHVLHKVFVCNALFSYSSFCSLPNSSSHSSKQVICVLCSLCMKPINICYEPLNAVLLIAYELLLNELVT